jgi:hypothetical protein
MVEKMETGERQSAGAAVDSVDRVNGQLRVAFQDFQRPSPQPGGDLHEVMSEIGRHLHNESLAIKTISDRLLAIEQQTKKRGSRVFTHYLLVICIGVAATLAWQSYGEVAKQIIATRAPELGWSPETKQVIANWVQQFGLMKPGTGPERTDISVAETQVATVAQTVPFPKTPATPSIDPEQVHQIALDLGALRQTVGQLAASQDQMVHRIDTLQTSNQEILEKIPAPPPPPPLAAAPAVAVRPAPGGALPSEKTQNKASRSTSLPVGQALTDGALRASCGPDVEKLCGGISREKSGVIKCLSSHRIELSPTCDAYVSGMPVHGAAQKGAP